MCLLISINLKSCCKYSCSLPAAKLTVYPQSWAPLSSLCIPPLFHLQSPSSPYLLSPYHSKPSTRPTSNVPGLSSSPSPHLPSLEVPTDVVTPSSSSVVRRRYLRLWSKRVSLLFGLYEGHLYQSASRSPNYLGLQKYPLTTVLSFYICCIRLQCAAMTRLASSARHSELIWMLKTVFAVFTRS